MIAGTISIELAANVARIQQDMERARRVVEESTSRMGRAAGVAKSALGAIAGILSVAAFASWIKGAIDAADAASKMSAKTGVAVKDIAGLQLAFDLGGAGGDAFGGSMIKLSKAITEGNKGLSALNIKTKDAGGALLGNKEVLYSVADAFAKMDDGARKTAMAIEIFGKSGAELIPLLNGGADGFRDMDEMARKLGLTISEKTAKDAEAFNDNLDLLTLGSQGVARTLAAEMLPTLSSLSGSFLESMTSGDKLAKTAEFIGTALKILYTVAVSIIQVFSTVGKVIGGVAVLIQTQFTGAIDVLTKVAKGDLSGAWDSAKGAALSMGATVKNVAFDVVDSWSATAKEVSNVWTGAGAKAFEETAKMRKAGKDLLAEQAAREAAGKKAQAAAAKAEETAKRDALAAQKKIADDYKKMMEKATADSEAIVDAINDEAAALRQKVKTYGMLPEAITRGKIAELEASKQAKVLTAVRIAEIQLQIDALHKLADAQGASTRQDENKKAADENLKAQVSMWESVEQTAHDTFISIFDSGKSAFDRLKDTLKNGLLDMLYQMTIKKWIFNIQASVSGEGQAEGAGAVGGGSDIVSVAKNIYGAFSGSLAKSIGGSISAAGKAFGSSALQSFGSGMSGGAGGGGAAGAGAAFAQYIPVVATAVAAYYVGTKIANGYEIGGSGVAKLINSFGALGGLANRAFGRKARETEDTWINGSFGASGAFSGGTDDWWREKGGTLRSDKTGVVKTAFEAEQAKALTDGYLALRAATGDFATTLGFSADAIANRSQAMVFRLTKDQAENEKLIAKFFTDVGDTMARELVPNLAAFSKAGEGAAATLQRIASNYAFVDVALEAMGKTFGVVGISSVAAREKLLELTGGIEGLGQGSAFFAANFLTEAQRMAPVAVRLKQSLAEMGLAFVDSREEFAQVVQGLKAANPDDAKTLAGLFKIQEAFAAIYPAAEAANDAMGDAKAAQDAMRASLGDLIGRMRNFGDAARSLKDGLLTGSLSTLTPEQQEAELRRQYEATKKAAFGGDEKAQGNFNSIATAYLTASQKLNGGDSTYSAALAGVMRDADAIAQWSDGQIDIAQASLNAQEAQLAALTQLNSTMTSIAGGVASGGGAVLVSNIVNPGETALVKEMQAMSAELAGLRADAARQTGDSITSNIRAQASAADAIVIGVATAVRPQVTARSSGGLLDN